ncbi:hypothetical protein VNO80_18049 [Phaseolus coccineus]|uniref:Translation initiation factor beta propellor-like domain-containing protein n=1 Tax=Phaseolus coccineus TaxID=3886 RepID=A0AAN9QW46_PHACN
MYLQSNGGYLAVKKDIPIQVLETENENDKIIAFAWEPKGHKFESYDVDELESMVTRTEHFMATDVEWDPTGRHSAKSASKYWAPRRIVLQLSLFLFVRQLPPTSVAARQPKLSSLIP